MFDYKNKFVVEAFLAWNITITAILVIIFFGIGALIGGKEGAWYLEAGIAAITAIFGMFWKWRNAVMNREERELNRRRKNFQNIHNYYLSKLKLYESEAINANSCRGVYEDYVYYEGQEVRSENYNTPIVDDVPPIDESIIYDFERVYEDIYIQFVNLKRLLDDLKKIKNGCEDSTGKITKEADENIETTFQYFKEIQAEMNNKFKMEARKLGLVEE